MDVSVRISDPARCLDRENPPGAINDSISISLQVPTFLWFKARGYTLYRPERSEPIWSEPGSWPLDPKIYPRIPDSRSFVNANYPWPSHDDIGFVRAADQKCVCFYPIENIELLLTPKIAQGNVVFAQDELGRHAAIKLVPDDTDELKIYQMLKKESLETLKENCVLPVLDLLPIPGYWFVVMPR